MAIHSQNDYKRLGERIRKSPDNVALEDLQMLQDLRETYKDPLSVIFSSLEQLASRVDKTCICVYRVKRIESIVSKLIRQPKMQLQRVEDIAGCRCILADNDKVEELYRQIQKKSDAGKLPFEIKNVNNYLEKPKVSGYRSIHVNVTLKNDNRRIEIQLRSIDQHNWATLVETTDVIFKTKIKEYGEQSNPDLYAFHCLLSKQNKELSKRERCQIAETAKKYNYIAKVGTVFRKNYINVRTQWYKEMQSDAKFFLVATNTDGTPEFKGFTNFMQAEKAYFKEYIHNSEHRNIVLAHLKNPNYRNFSIAYSNYFLTYNDIMFRIFEVVAELVVDAFNNYHLRTFASFYGYYLNIMYYWLGERAQEVKEFTSKHLGGRGVRSNNLEWKNTVEKQIAPVWQLFLETEQKLKCEFTSLSNLLLVGVKKSIYSNFRDKVNKGGTFYLE